MAKLIFHPELIPDKAAFAALCPFGAIEVHGDAIEPTAGCKMCGLCVKKGPAGAAEMVQDAPAPQVDKSAWRGILVYADHVEGALHPVTFELLGKARELAAEIGHPVYALLLGDGVKAAAEELTHWGADRVLVYDQPALRDFRLDVYTAAFADAVGDRVMVLVDGGIRTGLDVFKALALGADGVLIGRPFVTMVYGGGEEGVAAYVRKLTDELSDTMAMCGAHSLKEIDREMLWQG